MLKSIMMVIVGVALAVQAMASNDFARYQSILNRKPFGDVPVIIPPPTRTKARPRNTRPPPPPFTKTLKLVAILEDTFGVRVGFVDIKKRKNTFLYVGETEDGIKVISADYDKKETLLEKGGVQSWLRMNAISDGGRTGNRTSSRGRTAKVSGKQTSSSRLSYRERLKQRRAARTRVVKGPALTGAQLRKEYERVQMNLIREGSPPLPIPLTQEMDDQLVAEGVLPPNE